MTHPPEHDPLGDLSAAGVAGGDERLLAAAGQQLAGEVV
jgi:hypothetical protein